RPRISDTFAGGRQWLPELQDLGAQFGNPWVPGHTQGLPGIDLTGIWSDLQYPSVQTYIRQFGAYLNVIAGIGDVPAVFGEGLFDPSHSVVHVIGQNRAGIRPLTNLQARQT
ncbi:MAG: hypothetical protein ACREBC_38230, partial [Pyrinomonadaceae bacterium]